MTNCRYKPSQRICPEQLDAEAQVTPQDIAAAQEFWSHRGTPLLNALLNAKAEPEKLSGG